MQRYFLVLLMAILMVVDVCAQPVCEVKTFNLRDGLASNVVNGIEQTEDQLMWFTTWSGLSCYDGYRFTNYYDLPDDEQRVLTTNRLMGLTSNAAGDLWCNTYDQNPYLFDRAHGRFIDIMAIIEQHYGVRFHCYNAISMKNGHTWLPSTTGEYLVRIDDYNFQNKEGIQLYQQGKGILKGKVFNWLYEDNDGEEWIITTTGIIRQKDGWISPSPYLFIQQVGPLVYMATRSGQIASFDKTNGRLTPIGMPAKTEEIGMLAVLNETLLAATTENGLFIYDTEAKRAHIISLSIEAKLIENSRYFYNDSQKNLWMTYGNGSHLLKVKLAGNPASSSIQLYSIADRMPALRQSIETLFHEDSEGTLWIATKEGFFGYYDPNEDAIHPCSIRDQETQPYIERWLIDQQRNLWFGNNHNLALVQFKHQNIHFQPGASEVRSILQDSQNRLWTGYSLGQVIVDNKYLGSDGRLYNTPTVFSHRIYCIKEDTKRNIWIGSKGNGLYRLTPAGKLMHYTHNPNNPNSICSNQIYDVHEDHQGRIWIATFDKGISLFGEAADGTPLFKNAGNQLSHYPLRNFHKVRRITETADSTIVVSASNGLVLFKDNREPVENIKFSAHKHIVGDPASLLTSDVMQVLASSDGTIYIATVGGGLQRITNKELKLDGQPLQLENISHLIRNCGTIYGLVEDSLGNIWIGCENSLNMYDVKHDKVWCYGPEQLGENTRLSESYPVYNRVTDEMVLGSNGGTIHIKCQKLRQDDFVPSLVFGGVVFHNNGKSGGNPTPLVGDSLEVPADQRNLTIHFAALDYTDNHMIRYAYKLEGADTEWNHLGQERSISWNDLPHGQHRLLVQSTNAYGTWVDNIRTLHLIVQPTFWESWKGRSVQVLTLIAVIILAVWIYRMRTRANIQHKLDNMKLEFFSDISHKLRTPLTLIGGPVAEVLQTGELNETAQGHLEMVKRNTSRMLEMVNKMLAYSKGEHNYISDYDVPSYYYAEEGKMVSLDRSMQTTQLSAITEHSNTREKESKPHLLVVEDNDDLRDFLASILESEYEVTQAVNGREGLEKARTIHPDFILTDVMMPEMDGLSMVREIKSDTNTSHIPIVILSAKASMDDRIEGLKLGVNDYITKPFSATYLKQRMANIISNRRIMQQTYLEQLKKQAENSGKELAGAESGYSQPADTVANVDDAPVIRLKATNIVDSDKLMMEKLMIYIDEHLDNPELKIDDLASAVCLGRTVFYNKIRTLVGTSPVEFLRQIRIQRAEDMVAKSNEPYSRIAYAVGFNDPRYFGKCFKAQTGLTPSEYRERSQKKENP